MRRLAFFLLLTVLGCKSEVKTPPEAPPEPQAAAPAAAAAEAPAEEAIDVEGAWVCPAKKIYEFQAKGDFLVDGKQAGTWARDGKTVTVTYAGGKVLFYLESATQEELRLEHVSRGGPAPFLCTAGTAKVYRTMVHDFGVEDGRDEALSGSWESINGSLEIDSNGTYTMNSEDCHGGKWSLEGDTLSLHDRDCDEAGGKLSQQTTNHFELAGIHWFKKLDDTATVPLSNL